MVIIDGDVNLFAADWLILRVVELRDVGVSQSLIGSQSLGRVELKEALKKVKSIIRSGGKHVTKALGLGWWQ